MKDTINPKTNLKEDSISHRYIKSVIDKVKKINNNEEKFIQAVEEVLNSLEPVLSRYPEYIETNILERFCEPERQIVFKVPWEDDMGNIKVNRGFRIQFNGAIGPYKGGLRFHPSVDLETIKFLAFEQTLKNALTGLPIGGGKGGSDFDPKGKSDGEIRRFCESFICELYKHIGKDIDIPAGDIGVGKKEIGYLFGYYRRIKGTFENSVITGKDLSYGGSLIRPESTGFGIVYFCREILNHFKEDIYGKTVALSGFGNVSWGVCKKIAELGGKVITLSGPDGYIYDAKGVSTKEKIDYLIEMRNSGRDKIEDYSKKFNVPFFSGEKPWKVKADIIIPCAIENDIDLNSAKDIVKNGVKYLCEGANMPCTNEAINYMRENGVIIGPFKAANAGGVAVSVLEISQNNMKLSWSKEEVDLKLNEIMVNIHKNIVSISSQYGFGYDLISGANIYGFMKVAKAMYMQGIY
ncbi:NADP-specific glutamate dehydrogenase [Clostridium fallax]|uniref:Glutamate dehydrogenase n=1 Tax=Clostridium fallax TaxID=1533 RepID=A0A1M4XGY2_9CLOT|nr:NADP-specific glutamate dehydrogenase [Clostridium fallax]SHE92678.1 glutamate dehydrogenase (NADP+) [Clostridium fallax]SQB06401.1 NADP-specific glutamate dehydrogenase Gdh [Clostridium fallax]